MSTLFVKCLLEFISFITFRDKIQVGDNMATFGERLKKLRKDKKVTQKELANFLKIAESSVSMYERNEREPSFDLVKRLSNFFDVTSDYLLGISEDEDPIYVAFSHGNDELTEDEKEFLERQLAEFRELRKKFQQEEKK